MSDDIVIRAEDVSKRYRISHLAGQATLRDTMHHAARLAWRRLRWNTKLSREDFWALRDINFEIKRGEVVGIIGRNGAGKSTLLKVLSRITEPTTGRITLKGRVASLLEVGTGFHPELTGRDNIFLNGAILGMSRAEIRKKFDEIVAFAEVERFLDTPVKRYSSGMYVRLAFAVAAHLEPEILIVDEVLAVGDATFQDKCLGRIREVARGGRTVLFVSHNLASVQALCTRTLFLSQGKLQLDATPAVAISRYLGEGQALNETAPDMFHGGDPAIRIEHARFDPTSALPVIDVAMVFRSSRRHVLALEFTLSSAMGAPVAFAESGSLTPARAIRLEPGDNPSRWQIDVSRLANGVYFLRVQLVEIGVQHHLVYEHPVAIEVNRAPRGAARRALELNWQVGGVELDLHEVRS